MIHWAFLVMAAIIFACGGVLVAALCWAAGREDAWQTGFDAGYRAGVRDGPHQAVGHGME